jgi:MATE family multidrug resistance protein
MLWNVNLANIGIARGSGWQKLGAYVNLGAYYVFGIPIAVLLGFWFELRGKGLWIGILVGAFCQAFLLALITSLTNWEKQVCLTSTSFDSTSLHIWH